MEKITIKEFNNFCNLIIDYQRNVDELINNFGIDLRDSNLTFGYDSLTDLFIKSHFGEDGSNLFFEMFSWGDESNFNEIFEELIKINK